MTAYNDYGSTVPSTFQNMTTAATMSPLQNATMDDMCTAAVVSQSQSYWYLGFTGLLLFYTLINFLCLVAVSSIAFKMHLVTNLSVKIMASALWVANRVIHIGLNDRAKRLLSSYVTARNDSKLTILNQNQCSDQQQQQPKKHA